MSDVNPYSAPAAYVEDPARPENSFVKADRLTRLGAKVLDSIFYLLSWVPLFVLTPSPDVGDPTGTQLLVGFGAPLILFCVNTVFYITRAQTLGKMVARIRIVRADGSDANPARLVVLRAVATAVLSTIPLFALIDVLVIFGEKERCIHDYMADTIVVEAR